jgi:alginate O-acetyltransferase complex protein AlgI
MWLVAWTECDLYFVGAVACMFLALERTRFGTWLASLPRPARHAYVLLVILGSWMVFRAESLTQVHALGAAMLGANG